MTEAYKLVGKKLGINPKEVENIYKAYWLFIKTSIENINITKDMSREFFMINKTNFNLPSLGKLAFTFDKYKKIQEKKKHIKYEDKYKKDLTNV